MNSAINSVGIIGLGAFGTFCASLVPQDIRVISYDTHVSGSSSVAHGTLEQVCESDVVILAVPLSAYEETLAKIKPLIKPSTLIIDICSVKEVPARLVRKYLPDHKNLLITHPLFGPQSAKNGTTGLTLVVCEQSGQTSDTVIKYCESTLNLTVLFMTAEQHDKEMALVHALTFFVARGLDNMNITKTHFATPSFDLIQNLIDFDARHSEELFQTIQTGNPYAKQVRKQLLTHLESVDVALDSES
jgi:prephenate dehydrogenase